MFKPRIQLFPQNMTFERSSSCTAMPCIFQPLKEVSIIFKFIYSLTVVHSLKQSHLPTSSYPLGIRWRSIKPSVKTLVWKQYPIYNVFSTLFLQHFLRIGWSYAWTFDKAHYMAIYCCVDSFVQCQENLLLSYCRQVLLNNPLEQRLNASIIPRPLFL